MGETGTLEARIAELEKRVRNCTAAIAESRAYKSLLDQIGLLEAEMQQAKEQLETLRSKSARMRLRDIRHFVEADLRDVRGAAKVNELLDAKKTTYYTSVVLDFRTDNDTAAQSKAVDFALRGHAITGDKKPEVPTTLNQVNINIENASEDDLRSLIRLAEKLAGGQSEAVPTEPDSVAPRG